MRSLNGLKARSISIILMFLICAISCSKDEKLIQTLDDVKLLRVEPPMALLQPMRKILKANPKGITVSSLFQQLNNSDVDKHEFAWYIVNLGFTGNDRLAEPFIRLARTSKSEPVFSACLQALANVGTQESGEFLVETLKGLDDQISRFNILNLLAQMQYLPALPAMEEVLYRDTKEYYWQPIFIFGKMGDKGIPFLLERIDHSDRAVRWHTIHVLGRWLIAPEAAQPLRDHYWVEPDPELRRMILSFLEIITPDLETVEAFSKKVIAKETDKGLLQFAQETIDYKAKTQEQIENFGQRKTASPERFTAEYKRIYDSAGHEGDYEILAAASSFEDESKLKKLRERILQRNSDESFYDFKKINEIIMFNRMLKFNAEL